ncbi:histone H4 transcription factor [Anopheles bellator]|uniref:histone H4 transcription factor n=1 Tax=Anopheles bellator TaxID=139047 RepID=UPI00264A2E42|nr:histone H4 transcription factor [Anopheles bellator]
MGKRKKTKSNDLDETMPLVKVKQESGVGPETASTSAEPAGSAPYTALDTMIDDPFQDLDWEELLRYDGNLTDELPADTEKWLRDTLANVPEKERTNRVDYRCEWSDCRFRTRRDDLFFPHVEEHAEMAEPNAHRNYHCKWDLCDFITTKEDLLISHVHYHGYHMKLKTHAASLHKLIDIPKCNRDFDKRNFISDQPMSYTCAWDGCDERFVKIMEFFEHVVAHTKAYNAANKGTGKIVPCLWKDCKYQYKQCMPQYHIMLHCGRRTIACFVCGEMLSVRHRYIQHCSRMMDLRFRKYQCMECGNYYSTLALYKKHVYIHRDAAKLECPHCPFKCFYASMMKKHSLKHNRNAENPFPCDKCEYRARTAKDIQRHIETHDQIHRCPEFGCNMVFKTAPSKYQHMREHYNLTKERFECHICKAKYFSGAPLSKHLFFEHKVKRVPGFTLLRYKRDTDGMFRLRTYVERRANENGADVKQGTELKHKLAKV